MQNADTRSQPHDGYFSGKTVLVTGAGSGIGLELTRSFIAAGAKVIATDLNTDSLRPLTEELGPNCSTHGLNVCHEDEFLKLAEQLNSQGSLPDIVINNAGIAFLAGFTDTSSDDWKLTLDVNVLGVVYGCRTFIPYWQQTGETAHLVNVSSITSMAPMPLMSAYVASKYAVEGLSSVLSMELSDSNIKVHCVHPGVINTPIVQQEDKTNLPADKIQKLRKHYEKEGATPAEVAAAILKGIELNKSSIFVGPGSTMAPIMKRILPREWYKTLLKGQARKIGYL